MSVEAQHELHGALLGLGVCVALKAAGRPMSEALGLGAMTGTIATAAMKTYGHPDILGLRVPNSRGPPGGVKNSLYVNDTI